MRKLSAVALLAVALFLSACRDKNDTGGMATAPHRSAQLNASMGTCTTLANLTTLANQVFGAGSPNVQSVIGKLNNLDKMVQAGDVTDAQAQAMNIVTFVRDKAATGRLPGTTAQVDAFIGGVLCYAGLSPDTFLIQPTDAPQIITSGSGTSGLSLQGNTVDVPTLLTILTLDPNLPSGLLTKLDQYPTYISITTSSPLNKPAIVAICLGVDVPTDVFARLKLGHQASAGFEITPPADPSFLGCPTSVASTSKTPGWLRTLASLVLPKKAYAAMRMMSSGGIGGSTTEFSPFGAVDDALFATGGVGGSTTEFQRLPGTTPKLPGAVSPSPRGPSFLRSLVPGARSNTVLDGSCTSPDAVVGFPVDTLCRPVVTIKTAKGTVMQNVPVSWAVTAGGGTIAPDTIADQACGPAGASAATATDVNGQAGICWTLGATPGTNTVTATPSVGGDAPAGVVFVNSPWSFSANAFKITPTAGATGETTTFDGLAHAGSGTCSDGLTPALSYDPGGVNAPVNAGSYTLTVTCGDGDIRFFTVTKTAVITIAKASSTTTVTCPASVTYTGSGLTPCTAAVTGAGSLSSSLTPTYTDNTNVGTATATATYAGDPNHDGSSNSATFTIGKATSTTTLNCSAALLAYTAATQNPCSASATGAGMSATSVAVAYTPSTVHDAGAYSASASWAGDANHFGSSAGPTGFSISQASATATAGSGSMAYGGTVPSLPCTVAGLLTPDAGTVTCTTSVPGTLLPGVNVTTPAVSPASSVNYSVTKVNGTLTTQYVQSGYFASPMTPSTPSTKSAQKAGSTIPVKATLTTATGAPVTVATGNLVVMDEGVNGTGGSTVPAFSGTNVFKPDQNGNYNYGLNTGTPGFISGHFYFATATWNDGSKTTGWFYIK